MPDLLKITEIEAVGFVDEGANPEADILIWKRNDKQEAEMAEERSASDVLTGLDEADAALVQKLLDDADAAKVAAEQRAADAEASVVEKSDEPEGEDVLKGLDDDARAVVQKALDAAKSAEDRAERAEAKVDVEKGLRERAEMSEFAKAEFGHLSDEAGLVDVLSAMKAGLEPDIFDAAVAILRSANEVAKVAKVTKEIGSDDDTDNNTAWARIEKQAIKVADERKLTKAQAIDAVLRENSDLWNEYRAEQQEGK